MIAQIARALLHPAHLRRTGLIALVVGTWLTLFNQGNVLLAGEIGGWLWGKMALNYLTPFVVANMGLLSRSLEKKERQGGEEHREESTDRESRDTT